MSIVDMWAIERDCFDAGYQLVCGVDEAGRGPLAGPVCAAAVILPPMMNIPGLNDSKKLTDKKRQLRMELRWLVRKRLTRSIFYRQPFVPCSRRSPD